MDQTPYDRVKLARSGGRPTGLDYIQQIFQGFIELHGDRRYADDPAVLYRWRDAMADLIESARP